MGQIVINKENINDIIAREIEGSAYPQELEALSRWVRSSEQNRQYYNQMHEVHDLYMASESGIVNTDKAWSNLKSKMDQSKSVVQKTGKVKKLNFYRYVGYAASIAFIAMVGLYFIYNIEPKEQTFVTLDTGLQHYLKDGSFVDLEKNSALSLLKDKKREYNFSGKAAFTVKHSEKDPFIIHINNILIKDMGTVFTIDALPGNDTVQVMVKEGKVLFYTKHNSGISLTEGEEAIYIKTKNKFLKRSSDHTYKVLNVTFQNASFDDVVDQMSYSFRKNIVLKNESITNCNITVDFSDADFQLVKDIIEETLDISLVEKQDSIFIDGKGCN